MPAEEAERRTLNLFRTKLGIYQAGQSRVLDDWLDGDGKYGFVPIRENYHAIAAASFLYATFGDGKRLAECFLEWHRCVQGILARLDENKEVLEPLRMEFTLWGRPENLFMINCFVLFLEKNSCISQQELKSLPGLSRTCEFVRSPYLKWDAQTAPFDFTHVHRMVPIDDSEIMDEFSVAHSWSELQGNYEYQSKIVDRHRHLVVDCTRK